MPESGVKLCGDNYLGCSYDLDENMITSYLLILVGFMAFFAGYLDMTKD